MDSVPGRRPVASAHRKVLSAIENRVPLPDIHPSWYEVLALASSILYLFAWTPAQRIALVTIALLADCLDGATARRHQRTSRAGYIIDVMTDRASEAFIFTAAVGSTLGPVFFLLWLVNCALAFYSMRTNRHTALPLRFAWLLVLIMQTTAAAKLLA
jgi:phosphatidylglycerophosphate synthase